MLDNMALRRMPSDLRYLMHQHRLGTAISDMRRIAGVSCSSSHGNWVFGARDIPFYVATRLQSSTCEEPASTKSFWSTCSDFASIDLYRPVFITPTQAGLVLSSSGSGVIGSLSGIARLCGVAPSNIASCCGTRAVSLPSRVASVRCGVGPVGLLG